MTCNRALSCVIKKAVSPRCTIFAHHAPRARLFPRESFARWRAFALLQTTSPGRFVRISREIGVIGRRRVRNLRCRTEAHTRPQLPGAGGSRVMKEHVNIHGRVSRNNMVNGSHRLRLYKPRSAGRFRVTWLLSTDDGWWPGTRRDEDVKSLLSYCTRFHRESPYTLGFIARSITRVYALQTAVPRRT